MVKTLKIPDGSGVELRSPRFVSSGPLLIVGLPQRHSFETSQDIAGQWQRFMGAYREIGNKAHPIPVGVSTNMDDDGNFEYICGVEVSQFSTVPRGLVQLRIPAQTYAVFQHREHISRIGVTYSAILSNWLPSHNCVVAEGPSLERHLETFDPRTGFGGVEIWIPLKDADAG